ncbi:uncharacterized protein DS421_12g382730 [Arachis hypogaea]|nr:uncharacterized protein DS421_12g382730 [Arachis hypogaea]
MDNNEDPLVVLIVAIHSNLQEKKVILHDSTQISHVHKIKKIWIKEVVCSFCLHSTQISHKG